MCAGVCIWVFLLVCMWTCVIACVRVFLCMFVHVCVCVWDFVCVRACTYNNVAGNCEILYVQLQGMYVYLNQKVFVQLEGFRRFFRYCTDNFLITYILGIMKLSLQLCVCACVHVCLLFSFIKHKYE